MSACRGVFDILELAEAILLGLPISDLLCGVQQTCKQWKSVVDSSAQLQQALFLRPVPIPALRLFQHTDQTLWKSRWATSENDMESYTVVEHPLLTQFAQGRVRRYGKKMEAFIRPEASWRRSLVTQPPVASLVIPSRLTHPRGIFTVTAYENGVKLGELLTNLESDPVLWFESGYIAGWGMWKDYEGYYSMKSLVSAAVKTSRRGNDEESASKSAVGRFIL